MSIERLNRKSVLLIALLALPAVAHAVIVGTLTARFDDTLRGGGVVAEGASLSGRQDGVANASAAITIAGIPAGATVHRALLYWAISGGVDTTATINAVAVTGSLLSTVGQTCWGVNNSTFRADVTAQVTGNGVYTIGGLPSSTVATAADTDGAALVVTYQQLTSVLVRRVMIRDGGISTSGAGEIVIDTFTGIAPPISSTGTGRFHLIVGDGTNGANDGNVLFNSNVVGVNQFNGSDGSLWDVLSYNVSIPALLANATWSHNTVADCLLFETAIVDFWVALCGDGRRTGGEACDDGNTGINDGCSAQCAVESGWECVGEPSVCTLLPDQLFQNGFE